MARTARLTQSLITGASPVSFQARRRVFEPAGYRGGNPAGSKTRLLAWVLPFEPTDDQRDVLAAETEAVAQHVVDALFAGLVGNVVQIALGIGGLVVDRRRQHAALQDHHARDQLD